MSAIYAKAKEAFLNGSILMLSNNIKFVLVANAVYTPNFATDQYLSDIPSVIYTSPNLTGKSTTGGVFDADDLTLTAVSGNTAQYIVFYKDTGNPATSSLIVLIDDGVGLPITPSGFDITITWDNTNKIFKL